MYRKFFFTLCLILFSAAAAVAENTGSAGTTASTASAGPAASAGTAEPNAPGDSEAKTLRGMSVLGNNEAPMSLFIVPWKSSDLGVEANLTRTLNERDLPVDREVFMRELDYYQVSVGSKAK